MSKKTTAGADVTQSSFQKTADNQMKDGQIDATAHYKCLRNPDDGSIYYGEVAYIRKSTGQLIKVPSALYDSDVKALPDE